MEKDELIKYVKAVLDHLKSQLMIGVIFFEASTKNNRALADLDITVEIRRTILKNLVFTDYSEGPVDDHVHIGWKYLVFGTSYKGIEIYIKITRRDAKTDQVCISFHRAEHPMIYPLR